MGRGGGLLLYGLQCKLVSTNTSLIILAGDKLPAESFVVAITMISCWKSETSALPSTISPLEKIWMSIFQHGSPGSAYNFFFWRMGTLQLRQATHITAKVCETFSTRHSYLLENGIFLCTSPSLKVENFVSLWNVICLLASAIINQELRNFTTNVVICGYKEVAEVP